MLIVLLSWLIFFPLILSIGLLLNLIFLKRKLINYDLFDSFWIGVVALTSILQIYSLFLPLSKLSILFVVILVVFLTLYLKKKGFLNFKRIRYKKLYRKSKVITLLIVILIVMVLYNSVLEVKWYDTLLYHLNAVKWAGEYSVVPGLVHLHGRLGFNSSLHLIAAFIDNWIFSSKSSHLLISLLVVVTGSKWIVVILGRRYSIKAKIFAALTFPFIIQKIFSTELASLSPDIVVNLILIIIVYKILNEEKENFGYLFLLSILALTIKLTGIVAVVSVSIYILLSKRICFKKFVKDNSFFIAISSILIFGYFARNAIISGWLIFPFPIGNLNLPWSMSKEGVVEYSNIIKAWGRSPGKGYMESLDKNFLEWFIPWLLRHKDTVYTKFFLIGLISTMASLFHNDLSKLLKKNLYLLSFLYFLSLLGILVFIYSAPLIRFGQIFIWIFFSVSLIPIFLYLFKKTRLASVVLMVVIFYMIFNIKYLPNFDHKVEFIKLKIENSRSVEMVNVSFDGIEPEIMVWKPVNGDQCGNSQLPCTPEDISLRWREPGKIQAGFIPVD